MNVLCKCKELYPNNSDNDNMKQTSYLTGVSKASIIRMISEYKTTGSLSTPSKKQTPGKRTTRLQRYDEATLSGIRQIVDVYQQRKQYYSVKQVMHDINEDPKLPNISRKTTERLLKDLGICAKKSTKSVSPRGVKKSKEAILFINSG
ncbi:hypothetical protein JTE90_028395 [Oedothorax gibbosus]|uniref:Transposase n=1 Tax=Oedothorax gibbosus TaxID=931172 RepID=A0AAV6VEY6_9ARAC|nr:hypothetical protein JTE90_028395 [Oedothorax gibbosus]